MSVFFFKENTTGSVRCGRGERKICGRMRVAETRKKNYKTYEENRKNGFYYIIYFGIY